MLLNPTHSYRSFRASRPIFYFLVMRHSLLLFLQEMSSHFPHFRGRTLKNSCQKWASEQAFFPSIAAPIQKEQAKDAIAQVSALMTFWIFPHLFDSSCAFLANSGQVSRVFPSLPPFPPSSLFAALYPPQKKEHEVRPDSKYTHDDVGWGEESKRAFLQLDWCSPMLSSAPKESPRLLFPARVPEWTLAFTLGGTWLARSFFVGLGFFSDSVFAIGC